MIAPYSCRQRSHSSAETQLYRHFQVRVGGRRLSSQCRDRVPGHKTTDHMDRHEGFHCSQQMQSTRPFASEGGRRHRDLRAYGGPQMRREVDDLLRYNTPVGIADRRRIWVVIEINSAAAECYPHQHLPAFDSFGTVFMRANLYFCGRYTAVVGQYYRRFGSSLTRSGLEILVAWKLCVVKYFGNCGSRMRCSQPACLPMG